MPKEEPDFIFRIYNNYKFTPVGEYCGEKLEKYCKPNQSMDDGEIYAILKVTSFDILINEDREPEGKVDTETLRFQRMKFGDAYGHFITIWKRVS